MNWRHVYRHRGSSKLKTCIHVYYADFGWVCTNCAPFWVTHWRLKYNNNIIIIPWFGTRHLESTALCHRQWSCPLHHPHMQNGCRQSLVWDTAAVMNRPNQWIRKSHTQFVMFSSLSSYLIIIMREWKKESCVYYFVTTTLRTLSMAVKLSCMGRTIREIKIALLATSASPSPWLPDWKALNLGAKSMRSRPKKWHIQYNFT